MAEQGRNKPRKTQKKRKSSSLKERIKRAGEGMDREFEAMLKSVGNEELPIESEKDLLTAIPKGLYRTGKGKLKMLKAGAEGLLGYERGGRAAIKGTKFKGTF